MRCLWESAAMYHHFYNGGFSEDGIELFKFQPYILERAIYKKYPSFDDMLFSLKDIEDRYNFAKTAYKGKLHIDARTLSKLMRSPIPFLIKDDMPFVKIVEQNLGKIAGQVYKQLSILTHPHDYRSKLDDFFIDLKIEENHIITTTIELVEGLAIDRVLDLPKGEKVQLGLVEEAVSYLETPFSHGNQMRTILHSLGDDLRSVIMVAYDRKFPSLARMLDQIRHFSIDYLLDTVFGYTEQCIIKWKAIVEYFALFNYYIDNPYYLEFNNLTFFHTTVTNLDVLEMDSYIVQEDKDHGYAEYLKVFPSGVNQEAFEKAFYSKTLGFLVNEQGEVPSLNELAKSFLEKASAGIDNGKREVALPKDRNAPIEQSLFDSNIDNFYMSEFSLKDWLTMLYEESQIMSHATGYLYFANSGAWTDGQTLGEYLHKFERYTLKRLCELLATSEMKQKLGGKTLLNMVRNYHKNSAERMETFMRLLRVPKGQKPKM